MKTKITQASHLILLMSLLNSLMKYLKNKNVLLLNHQNIHMMKVTLLFTEMINLIIYLLHTLMNFVLNQTIIIPKVRVSYIIQMILKLIYQLSQQQIKKMNYVNQ